MYFNSILVASFCAIAIAFSPNNGAEEDSARRIKKTSVDYTILKDGGDRGGGKGGGKGGKDGGDKGGGKGGKDGGDKGDGKGGGKSGGKGGKDGGGRGGDRGGKRGKGPWRDSPRRAECIRACEDVADKGDKVYAACLDACMDY